MMMIKIFQDVLLQTVRVVLVEKGPDLSKGTCLNLKPTKGRERGHVSLFSP